LRGSGGRLLEDFGCEELDHQSEKAIDKEIYYG
jgi:hypothetical protein